MTNREVRSGESFPNGAAVRAFTLVEIVIALGIIAFAVIMLLALIPVGISSSRNSHERTVATGLLESLEAELFLSPGSTNINPRLDAGFLAGTGPAVITNYLNASGKIVTLNEDAYYGLVASRQPLGQLSPTDTNYPAIGFGLAIWWPARAAREQAEGTLDSHVTVLRRKSIR